MSGGVASDPVAVTGPAPRGDVVAVVVCRDGRLPAGAEDVTAEARGRVVIVGAGASTVTEVAGASEVWVADTPVGSGALARLLAPLLVEVRLVLMPASPDGRDLAPRLASEMARPLLAAAVSAGVVSGTTVRADLLRVDGAVVVPVVFDEPAVATLLPGVRAAASANVAPATFELSIEAAGEAHDAAVLELVEPDPATMDLADAKRVFGGGAGLVPSGASDDEARSVFELLVAVAGELGASAGATRVVTDAGWMPYDRQIGTTGVAVDPEVYVAFGVSGASQHVGGLGAPQCIASVNIDPSSPMTAMADLGVVADAPGVVVELAKLLGLEVPAALVSRLSGAKDPNRA